MIPLAVALAVVPVHNLVDFSFFGSGVILVWAVLVGWAMAFVNTSSEPEPAPARGRVVFVAAVAAVLLGAGADKNAKTNLGNTALAKATQKGHADVAALLR